MSRTELHVVSVAGDVEGDTDLRNSYGSAFRIWDSMYERHFHPKPRYSWGAQEPMSMMAAIDKHGPHFWGLAGDESVPLFARRVFAWTFDRVIVPRAECAALADDVERFDREYPAPHGTVNHLPALAQWLRDVAQRPDVRGAAVNWTSVGETWPQQPIDPKDDDSDYRPYNVDRDGDSTLLSNIVPAAPLTPLSEKNHE